MSKPAVYKHCLSPNAVKLTLAALLAITASACGDQGFVSIPSTVSSQGPGAYAIAPKVDILLAEDDTGSMFEAYSEISQQLPNFLNGLDSRGWNYRFATTPLVNKKFNRNIDQILASKFDPNWGSQWVAPYPGASPGLVDSVFPQYFRKPESYSQFLTLTDIDNSLGGKEDGLANIDKTLYSRAPGVGFLRPDALLVVMVLGNGEDTSGVNYCTRSDGVTYVCPPPDTSYATSLANYKNRLAAVKASPALIRFYAAVSKNQVANCRGGAAYFGSRYKSIEADLGGDQNFDICSQSITSILDSINTSLTTQKLSFRTRFLFIAQEPNPATIAVRKFIGGSPTNFVDLPNDSNNGWTYAGYQTNVYAIDAPVQMNKQTGFAIELHGSAKLIGDDRADITFKPKGFTP